MHALFEPLKAVKVRGWALKGGGVVRDVSVIKADGKEVPEPPPWAWWTQLPGGYGGFPLS